MNTLPVETQTDTAAIYNQAVDLLVNQRKTTAETADLLIRNGHDKDAVNGIIANLEQQINDATKDAAKKDILYGALWCVGGTVATLADIGFIFWGAIVFGGIQLIKGLVNYSK